MADTPISGLTAVVTPAGTDQIPVNQGGTTKRLTAAQLKTFITAAPVFDAGSGTAASKPTLTSGTVLTTPEAGAIEYFAPGLYFGLAASCRAVVAAWMWARNTADFTLSTVNTAQRWLQAANDTLTLPGGNTTYEFELLYAAEGLGGTTRTTGMLFGGTATIGSIRYQAMIQTGAANALGTTQSTKMCAAATNQVLNATAATAAEWIRAWGLITITTTGTLIPQIQWSANPTGTPVCKQNSYFRIRPIGADSAAAIGNWA